LVVCDLTLAGIGWNTTADAQLAAQAAARARAYRDLAREERSTASPLHGTDNHTKRKEET
jgi:hypothetical protein